MSWVFGAIHDTFSPDAQQRFRSIHSDPIQSYRSEKIYVAVGGLKETCRSGSFQENESQSKGWAVIGSGLRLRSDDCIFLSSPDWQNLFGQVEPVFSTIDGHFCALRWNDDSVEVWIDEIGLRTLYVAPAKEGYLFSTRLDWLAQAASLDNISFSELGSAWLLTNKLNYNSPIHNITRIGPGGRARITVNSFTSANQAWTARVVPEANSSLVNTLEGFVHPVIAETGSLSLGMSGGFDCRLLLSLLVSQKKTPFVLHTFGSAKNPDVIIAKDIAGRLQISLTQYDEPLPSVDTTISLLKTYVAQTGLTGPASSMLKLRYYEAMHREGKTLIDGGYGEISRRQMGNRLLSKGTKILGEGDSENLFPLFAMHRASIFNQDVVKEMREAAKQEITEALSGIEANSIGAESLVDLFLIRTRVANNSPGPQDWIDSQIVNYMPYSQPSFLREVFRTSLKERRNARLYRRTIRERSSVLTRFPLAKDGVTYPYAFTTIPSWIWRTAKKQLNLRYEEPYRLQLLLHVKEFVQDIVNSNTTRQFSAYDYSKIRNSVSKFYEGKNEFAPDVDWWLTFEIWRRTLTGK
ncbi:MAG: hypothetical protein ABI623_09165 [bacterium]